MGWHVIALSSLALIGAAGGWGDFDGNVWVDREASVMGSRLRVELAAETEVRASATVDLVFATAVALERSLLASDVGSDLGLVNGASPGIAVPVSAETFDLLLRAWDFAGRTDGAFDPTVGALIDAWQADAGVVPEPAALDRALASTGRRCFDLSPSSRTVARRCPDAWIDVHGLGKGAVLAAIDDVLDGEGISDARVDFGRQTLIRGAPTGEAAVIRIPVPGEDETAFEWRGVTGSVATRSQFGGENWPVSGPVVDPRSGFPVVSWGGVTVRSDDPVEADALATALLVMGPDRGLRWLAARPDVEAVFLVDVGGEWRACGRLGVVETWSPVSPRAAESDAGLLARGLLACPEPVRQHDTTVGTAGG